MRSDARSAAVSPSLFWRREGWEGGRGGLSHWKTPLGWQCIQDHDAAVPIEAKAGDVVVFSSLTPHRTGPNTTSEDRKSYILQYGHDGAQAWGQGNEGVTQDHPGRQFIVVRGGDYA